MLWSFEKCGMNWNAVLFIYSSVYSVLQHLTFMFLSFATIQLILCPSFLLLKEFVIRVRLSLLLSFWTPMTHIWHIQRFTSSDSCHVCFHFLAWQNNSVLNLYGWCFIRYLTCFKSLRRGVICFTSTCCRRREVNRAFAGAVHVLLSFNACRWFGRREALKISRSTTNESSESVARIIFVMPTPNDFLRQVAIGLLLRQYFDCD